MAGQPRSWQHGYELSRQTGLQSGTLYPLLIRLNDQGLLESRWEQSERAGTPPRHAYRLTATGLAFARTVESPRKTLFAPENRGRNGMTLRPCVWRRLAAALLHHARVIMPSRRSSWADAMGHEIQHIERDFDAFIWAAGCVVASYVERSRLAPLVRTLGARLLLAALIIGRAVDLLFATVLTLAYRFHHLGTASFLGGFTPGDDYRRLIPLMDATPWWIHALWVAGSTLCLIAAWELMRNRPAAFLAFGAAWIAGAVGDICCTAMPEFRAAFSFPTPQILRDIVIPTTRALLPILVAAALWVHHRYIIADGASRA